MLEPSLAAIVRRITYFLTSSSLLRLKRRLIFVARLGPSLRGTTLSVSPSISFSPK